MGLAVNIGGKYSLFSEVKMSSLTYAPTNYHLIKKTNDGKDITAEFPQDTPLEESYTNTNGQNNVGLKSAFPFSYVGFNFGLKRNF